MTIFYMSYGNVEKYSQRINNKLKTLNFKRRNIRKIKKKVKDGERTE